MYGSAAVSEQELAERAMASLPARAIVVGDRNFGVFSIAWAAQQRGLSVVIRLTQPRAQKLAGGPIQHEGEQPVKWVATPFDGRRQGGMPAGACVEGRLIAKRIGRGKSKQWLYLFTTEQSSADEITTIYGQRWNIETDLRSVKRTVGLHHISARTESMMEKELYAAMAAYNLVRAVMALAARQHGLSPRQLSFSFVYNVVNARWDRVQSANTQAAYRQEVFDLLDIAAQGKHPNRKKRRSSPRAVWHRRHTFPARKESPTAS
jgi:DDE family transposase